MVHRNSAAPIPPGIVSYTCFLLQIAQLLSGLMSCFPAVWRGAILSAIVPTPFWKAVTAHTVLRRKDVIRQWCMVMVTILTHASIGATLFGSTTSNLQGFSTDTSHYRLGTICGYGINRSKRRTRDCLSDYTFVFQTVDNWVQVGSCFIRCVTILVFPAHLPG